MVRLSLCFLIAMSSFMIAHATILPRQDIPVGAPLSTSSSSFNWWPYPAGGVTTSTSSQVPTVVLETSASSSSSSSSPTPVPLSSTSGTKITSHSSETPVMHITALASTPATSLSSGHKSLLKSSEITLSPLWLVPVCLLLGAIVGCALGWLAWRRFDEKRDRHVAGHILDGYAWPYKHETERRHDAGMDNDVERGRGLEYLSLGRGSSLHVDGVPQRSPSTGNTSGARTWVGHAQARKRSGAVGPSRPNTSSVHENDDSVDVKSPLLTQSEVHEDSKPLSASPLPSPYSYGDDEGGEGDEEPCGTVRHKSVRRRIWERLGLAESELGRKKSSKTHEEEGRHTWSAGAMQERGADVDRTFSLWGRRKTMKEGRVERWVRSVRGEERDSRPSPADQDEAPTETMETEQMSPQYGTPELVLNTLRRVSPTPSRSRRVDHDPAVTPEFVELFSSMSHPSSPTLDMHSYSMTPSSQRRSLRRHAEMRPRGVSLQDPGPISSLGTIKRTTSTSRDAFPQRPRPRPSPSSRSKPSQQSTSSPAPPSPSSVSRYSASPHISASATLNRSPTRTPSRRMASREIRPGVARAVPSSRLARPVSNTTPPSARLARPVSVPTTTPPARGVHAVPHRRPTPELPAGPSCITSPPLQSALSFDDTLPPPSVPPPSWALTSTSGAAGARFPLPSRAPRHSSSSSSKRVSTSSGSTPRNANARTHATAAAPASRPLSPRERHLARRNANARVEMILSRTYSSRQFDERPVSPTMFGAVISEEGDDDGVRLADERGATQERLGLLVEDEGGIEQRLDRLRRHGG